MNRDQKNREMYVLECEKCGIRFGCQYDDEKPALCFDKKGVQACLFNYKRCVFRLGEKGDILVGRCPVCTKY